LTTTKQKITYIACAKKRIKLRMPKKRKLAIMGSRSVGKSTVAIRFVKGSFVETYNPTVENIFTTTIEFKGESFLTEIVDTAGQVCHSNE
jgi:small GTP-binding protein